MDVAQRNREMAAKPRRSRIMNGSCVWVKVTDQDPYMAGERVRVDEKEGRYWNCLTYRDPVYPPETPDEYGLFRREDLVTEEDAANGYH